MNKFKTAYFLLGSHFIGSAHARGSFTAVAQPLKDTIWDFFDAASLVVMALGGVGLLGALGMMVLGSDHIKPAAKKAGIVCLACVLIGAIPQILTAVGGGR
jgi:hypothetical protein